ncbi:hypothetical protein JCM11491_007196 [Sporobolomyces phaffii]
MTLSANSTAQSLASLPTELLVEIFTRVSSSPADLYHVLATSRRFASIVRPILYRHVTITSRQQRKRLRSVRKEDAQLVKQVTILGDGPIETEDIKDYFESSSYRFGSDCVHQLLTGQILDISAIETLHVRNVVEYALSQTATLSSDDFFQIASHLSEISVWGHQGGAQLWHRFLREKHVPQLRRLGFAQVTDYRFEAAEFPCDCCYDDEEYGEHEVLVELPSMIGKRVPLSHVDILVAERPRDAAVLRGFPLDRFLAVFLVGTHLLPLNLATDSFHRLVYSNATSPEAVMNYLRSLASRPSQIDNQSIHLFLPPPPVSIRGETYRSVIRQIELKGFRVHELEEEDDEDSTSLLTPTAITLLQRNGTSSSQA